MLVKCINNQGVENFLTKGKVYKVTEVEEDSTFIIKDDKGTYAVCDDWRFKKVNEDFISNLEQENEELKAKIEELEKSINEKNEQEEPFIKEEQEYLYIDGLGDICNNFWNNYSIDKQRLGFGNCYPFTEENKEQVEKEVKLIAERKKLQNQMEMFAKQNNEGKIDWNDCEQEKWFLCINWNNDVVTGCHSGRYPNVTYFTSREVVEKALEKFGARLKELYINTENNSKNSKQKSK